jgi:hypothetical protein
MLDPAWTNWCKPNAQPELHSVAYHHVACHLNTWTEDQLIPLSTSNLFPKNSVSFLWYHQDVVDKSKTCNSSPFNLFDSLNHTPLSAREDVKLRRTMHSLRWCQKSLLATFPPYFARRINTINFQQFQQQTQDHWRKCWTELGACRSVCSISPNPHNR